GRVRSIGVLVGGAPEDAQFKAIITALSQALQELGWVDGKTAKISYRGSSNAEELRKCARELVALAPDVLIATGGASAGPLLAASKTIPIVFADVPDPVACRRRALRWTCRHDGDERRDHAGIEWIALGQNPTGSSELSQLERVDLSYRYVGCEQSTHDATLVTAACFDPDRRDREATQLLNQFGPACGVITHRAALFIGQDHHVQTIPRHVDTAEREHSHLRIPFLLMRARARATVRVWKKRLELQAHSRCASRNDCGLPVATRAET